MRLLLKYLLVTVIMTITTTTTAIAFTDNANGTITDSRTGLMWQKDDDGITRTWDAALTYCDGLSLAGQTDWRLPNRTELMSIIDYTSYNPSINTVYFPNTKWSYYWSSTTYAGLATYAWNVYFGLGYVDYSNLKTFATYVRCVRGGQ